MFTGDTNFKKLYYYVLCVMALYVLMWGAINLSCSTIGLISFKRGASISAPSSGSPSLVLEKDSQGEGSKMLYEDALYQTKLLYEQLWDSLARVVIAGGIFLYCRKAVEKVEG